MIWLGLFGQTKTMLPRRYMLTHDTRHAKVSTDRLGHPPAEHTNVNEYKTQLHEGEYGKVELLCLLQMKEVF